MRQHGAHNLSILSQIVKHLWIELDILPGSHLTNCLATITNTLLKTGASLTHASSMPPLMMLPDATASSCSNAREDAMLISQAS